MILLICLRSLENQIKETFNLARNSSKTQTKSKLALEEVSKVISLISEKLNAYEQERRGNEMGRSLKWWKNLVAKKIRLNDNDIDRSHVIGCHNKVKKKEKRNIIKNFVRYNARCNLFCKKRKLKGTGKSVMEKFTTKRTVQLNDTREKCGFNVCSYDGKIFYKVNNELKVYYD